MAGIPLEPDDPEEQIDADMPYSKAYEDETQKDLHQSEADDYSHDCYNKLISVKVMLPMGDTKLLAKVICCKAGS